MPERSFGRTVRYRRTKLGLSQAQLGELVGRSASSIRSWERDLSTPNDTAVITALSAILDLDQQSLFDKAGLEVPVVENQPTVEEALASLAPPKGEAPLATDEFPVFTLDDPPPGLTLDVDSGLEAEVREHPEGVTEVALPVEREPEREPAPLNARPELVGVTATRTQPEPAFVTPPEPFVMTTPTPPVVEPSYIEDNNQRQLYRVRNLATVVLIVALVIIFLWSMSNAIDALGTWWDEFFGNLRL
jgi:transcriptional regulator with XRE-family HTH domain